MNDKVASLEPQQGPEQGSSTGSSDAADPLVEQMGYLSHITERPAAASQQKRRARRFSDADRATTTAPLKIPSFLTAKPQQGLKALPEPESQLHITSKQGHEAEPTKRELDTSPLEPHICKSTPCAASLVFGTTELLEIILTYLSTRDLIALQLTNTKWRLLAQTSPSLRLHFFTYSQFRRPAADFQLLPLSLPGLSTERGEVLHLGQWIRISMTAQAARRILPGGKSRSQPRRSRSIYEGLRGGLGTRPEASDEPPWPAQKAVETTADASALRYEDLYVTQPPLLGMQAFVPSCRSIEATLDALDADDQEIEAEDQKVDVDGPACAKLSCDAGVTLGFLAETAQSLLSSGPRSAALCPAGEEKEVVFKAIMSFTDSHESPRKRRLARSVIKFG